MLAALLPGTLSADEQGPRIATLGAGHAHILIALGLEDELVLIPEDPSLADRAERATRYRRIPSAESLAAHEPDLLIASNPARHGPILQQAERLGIETAMVERTRPPIQRVRALAELCGRRQRGRELVNEIEAGYAAARDIVADAEPVPTLHLSSSGAGTTGAVTGAGRGTSAHRLIRRAGGINVGARAGLERYQSLSAEGVIAMAPEAIVVSRLELPALGGRSGIWQQVPGLAHTPAARHERLIVLDHAAIKFDAPASGAATLALARALHDDE